MVRRSVVVAAALATLAVPFAAFAQPVTGTVTTGPASAAPVLAMPLIFLLAVTLAGVAAYRMRRRIPGRVVGLVLAAAVVAMAGLGYAKPATIMIMGSECAMQTTKMFFASGAPAILMSDCQNAIHILDIQLTCPPDARNESALPFMALPCSVGQTLAQGESCPLPICGPV